MIHDNLLLFTGTSNGASAGITIGPYTDRPTTGTQAASNIIDLGVTGGIPASAQGGGARDIGVGDSPALELSIICSTAMGGGTSLQAQLQGAPDDGSGGQGAYTTMWTGPTVLLAALVAGAQIANVTVPRVVWEQVLPRFLKLNFISAGTFTSGAVMAGIVLDREDQIISTAGLRSGYPAGVVVAN